VPGYIKQADNLHPYREILYKQGRHFNATNFYIIEISKHEGFLNIAAFDANSPESLMIEIKPDKS
jgi:hypothetical protein